MCFGVGEVLGEEFLLQVEDQFVVFCVYCWYCVQFQVVFEVGYQGIVGGYDGVFVGYEVFEVVYFVLCYQFVYFLGDFVVLLGDGDVEVVVCSGFLCLVVLGVEGFQQ